MTISAIIPTIGATPLLGQLLKTLSDDDIATTVFDNGCVPSLVGQPQLMPACAVAADARNMGIYEMWDRGVYEATTDYVAILNDDIIIQPGSLQLLAEALDSDPELDLVCADYQANLDDGLAPTFVQHTRGTYRTHGVCGWCFVVRRETYPWVGPGYRWWCGDDELVARIEAKGRKTGIYRGVPVAHQGEASASQRLWTHDAKGADLAEFTRRWG